MEGQEAWRKTQWQGRDGRYLGSASTRVSTSYAQDERWVGGLWGPTPPPRRRRGGGEGGCAPLGIPNFTAKKWLHASIPTRSICGESRHPHAVKVDREYRNVEDTLLH